MFHGISESMPSLGGKRKKTKKHPAGTIIQGYHYSEAPSWKLKHLLLDLFKTRLDHYINFTAKEWANLLVILYSGRELIKAQGEHGESG